MVIYVGVSKQCDSCGGDMQVIASSKPLTEEQRREIDKGYGCAVTQFFEVEIDAPLSTVVNMNPSRGY